MSRQEERQNAKKVFQNGTARDKFQYLWDYYRWHFLAVILVLGIIISTIYNAVTKKESVLEGYFFNTYDTGETSIQLQEEFLSEYPIDTRSQEILLNTSLYYSLDMLNDAESYQVLQALMARVAAGQVDFIVCDVDTMQQLTYYQVFTDLSDVLTADQMTQFEPYFLYYDNSVLRDFNNADPSKEIPDFNIAEPSDPDAMDEPVPVMITLRDSDKLSGLYPDSNKEYAFAFTINGANIDKTIDFLHYLID